MKKLVNYGFFTAKEIKPCGYMRKQLEIEASGLAGNLHKIWPDVRDSAWIGGNCEGWERVPYWLDGFVPLSYLLEDEELISVSKRYINAIIDRQREDGWICPCDDDKRNEYDVWAIYLICKTLYTYYECSGDERAYKAVYKAAKNLYELLSEKKIKLFNWANARWFEMFISLLPIYNREKEDWVLKLGEYLLENGMDYEKFSDKWIAPDNGWTFETHIVNIAMMLKCEAEYSALLGTEYTDKAERMFKILDKYNGTSVGTFTGDECLSGTAPVQGTELCAVVEFMFSFERLFAKTGENKWLDRLEKVAFNALPATFSDDMWTHQYDQQVNQIACEKLPGRSIFRSNNGMAHFFGLDPNFGCCTANFPQGWPKLVLSSFFKTKKGIMAGARVPSVLDTEINGKNVRIELETEYPFRDKLVYKIDAQAPCDFEFSAFVPSWAEGVKLNGENFSGKKISIKKEWFHDTVVIEFSRTPKLQNRPNRLKSVCYGPLVFSLPIKTRWEPHDRNEGDFDRVFPYCDYELHPESEWQKGFVCSDFTVKECKGDDIPFSSVKPKLMLKAKMAPMKWGYDDGFTSVCRRIPLSRKAVGKSEEVLLYPYGCSKLRLTDIPIIK